MHAVATLHAIGLSKQVQYTTITKHVLVAEGNLVQFL